jgi:neutral trehalase
VELSCPLTVSTGKKIDAAECKRLMEKQKKQVLDICAGYGELAEAYNAMRTCLAWNTIYEPEKEQVCSPVSRLWSMPGYILWEWDTYFAAMQASLENRDLAYANAIAITHEKTGAGFVPNGGGPDGSKILDRSEPPVGALAVREIYRRYREKWFVEYLFEDLLAWNRWWAKRRRLSSGQLCWGSDPVDDSMGRYRPGENVDYTFNASCESGMDNSPMYFNVPFNMETRMLELADVGLTGLYILDCEALADLAAAINRKTEEAELRKRAEESKQGLEELWDDNFGLYCNKRTDTGEFSHRISPTNFYALFSDKVPADHAQRMVQEHFYNTKEFFGDYMIPTIARNDPDYNNEYWRGRIWPPTNFLTYVALKRAGFTEPGKILAEKGLALIMKEWLEKGHVHENYHGDTGEGCRVITGEKVYGGSDRFYHWGGLLSYIALIDAGYADNPVKPL